MSQCGQFAIIGNLDGSVYLYDLINSQLINTVYTHQGSVTSVDMSSDFKYIVSGGTDNVINLHVNDFRNNFRLKLSNNIQIRHDRPISTLSISTCANYFVVSCMDKVAYVYNMNGDVIQVIEGHEDHITSVYANGKYIFTGGMDGKAILWQVYVDMNDININKRQKYNYDSNSVKIVKIKEFNDENSISSVRLTNDNAIAITGGKGNIARVYDIETGRLIRNLIGHEEAITSIDSVKCQNK